MFEIIKTALGSVFGGKTPQGESQILNSLTELLKGQDQKKRDFELALEKEFQKRLDKEIEDRQDARSMQKAALAQNDLFSKRFIYVLSAIVISIMMLALGSLFYFDIPKENEAIVNRVVDIFQNAGITVLGFYFGTMAKNKKDNGL